MVEPVIATLLSVSLASSLVQSSGIFHGLGRCLRLWGRTVWTVTRSDNPLVFESIVRFLNTICECAQAQNQLTAHGQSAHIKADAGLRFSNPVDFTSYNDRHLGLSIGESAASSMDLWWWKFQRWLQWETPYWYAFESHLGSSSSMVILDYLLGTTPTCWPMSPFSLVSQIVTVDEKFVFSTNCFDRAGDTKSNILLPSAQSRTISSFRHGTRKWLYPRSLVISIFAPSVGISCIFMDLKSPSRRSAKDIART